MPKFIKNLPRTSVAASLCSSLLVLVGCGIDSGARPFDSESGGLGIAGAVAVDREDTTFDNGLGDVSANKKNITASPVYKTESGGGLYLQGELIVGISDQSAHQEVTDILQEQGVLVLNSGSSIEKELGFLRLSYPAEMREDEVREILATIAAVDSIERHYFYNVSAVPDDPSYGQLWGLEKMQAPLAWERGMGSSSVKVMVIDTGIDLDHPDLLANLGAEEFDRNDQFVDDKFGWDFIDSDNQPDDTFGHGTHVAGIIGGVGNNTTGIVGINWDVTMIAGRVCSARSCSTFAVSEALVYAAQVGADIVNMSLGGYHPPLEYEQRAIERVGAAGGLIVAAAGNDQTDTDVQKHYPSSYEYDYLISVAATDEADHLATFSNYGATSVDLGAPGTNIVSSLIGGGYGAKSGTSMAAPYVAGAAALYLSQHPEADANALRQVLLDSAEPLEALKNKTLAGARLDLARLVNTKPASVCGDGVAEGDEACDDGNLSPWDGCSPTCQPEPTCSVSGGSCDSICGDGLNLGDSEECDDGNTIDGDGCSSDCRVEEGFECNSSSEALPQVWQVPVVYRDFNSSPQNGGERHPDFEIFAGSDRTPGLVGPTLDPSSGRPVYTGACEGGSESGVCNNGPQMTSAADFAVWYSESSQWNRQFSSVMSLNKQPDDSYTFTPNQLFPLDGQGFVQEGTEASSGGHNFGFTTELRSWFRYEGEERLDFSGDDDVWVFINGILAFDLGGLHPERSGFVVLSGSGACESILMQAPRPDVTVVTCRELGLELGKVYEIALFHAERHTNASNFNLTMRGFAQTSSSCEALPCPSGYLGSGVNCEDENECDSGSHDCDSNAQCDNNDGGYSCKCPVGLVGDGIECEDKDECQDGSAICPDDAECVNLMGTYRCDGGETSFPAPDIDECALRLDACDADATCTNTDGSYMCTCNEGYIGNGFFCGDLDECTGGLNSCDEHASCFNEIGGFVCECNTGWQGDGLQCEDEDECEAGTAACDPNATCENELGTYGCDCNGGYSGDGFACEDVDECSIDAHDCPENADCVDGEGTFSCSCSAGFEGDGYDCLPVGDDGDGGASGGSGGAPGGSGGSNGGDSAGTGGSSEGVGGDDGAGDGTGGMANASGGSEGSGGAGNGEGGGGTGAGAGGETASGGGGEDDNSTGGNGSQGAGGAGNTEGGGGTGADDGAGGDQGAGGQASGGAGQGTSTCAMSDPCAGEAACNDGPNGPECTCDEGFIGDGFECDDEDECAEGTHTCHDNATCQNAWGSYYCNCNPGYYGDGEECLLNPGFVEEVVTASDHTCALLEGGSVRCWGFNDYGQLGYGDTETVGDNERADARGYVDIGAQITQVETGFAHTCALSSLGEVYCWGRNEYGQLGYGHTDAIGDDELPRSAGAVDVGGVVVRLAAGGEHTCALLVDGSVRCWGLGVDGQLGSGSTESVGDDENPSAVGAVNLAGQATALTAGRDHSCAILDGGAVTCWGRGTWGATGLGHVENVGDDELPTTAGIVDLGGPASLIDAGWYHTCAVVAVGGSDRLRCFGFGDGGPLGYGSTENVGDDEVPSSWGDVLLSFAPQSVTAGLHHTCITNSVNEAFCFGLGLYGRLGYANEESIGDDETPVDLPPILLGSRVMSISAGTDHSCAVLYSGTVRCWGSAAYGQLGTGAMNDMGDDEHPDSSLPILAGDVDECLLGTHSCDPVAICDDLETGFQCTCPPGYSGDGFSCFALDDVVTALEAGENHTCAIVTTAAEYASGDMSGAVRCWGAGSYGRLGLGSAQNIGDDEVAGDAAAVVLDDSAVQLALGGFHTCALLKSGAVRCWGDGTRGQLGLGYPDTIGDDEVPTAVDALNIGGVVTKIVAGTHHTCALLQDGAVRCWGEGDAGRLGYGNTADVGASNEPAQVGSVSLDGVAIDIAAGNYHTCALLAGTVEVPGGVRCWGVGDNGRLGNGSTASIGDDELPSSAPLVDLGGEAVALAAGDRHTCAVMIDGTARCFGYGFHGVLGYGTTNSVADDEPAFAGGLIQFDAPVSQVAAGANHSCALLGLGVGDAGLLSGRVQCWGYGPTGALGLAESNNVGDETPANLAPPVEVGGYAFHVTAGASHTCALLADGVKCWGLNTNGQLGYGTGSPVGLTNHPASVGMVPLF